MLQNLAWGMASRRRRRYFRGNISPANRTRRSLEKSRVCRFLYVASRESAEGTEFHTDIFVSEMYSASFAGKMATASGTTTTQAPALNATKTSKIDISKCNGARLDNRSSFSIPKKLQAELTKVKEFRCESMTPFGLPVEPEVNRI